MTDTIVVVPDLHLPYEDRRLVRSFIRFIGEFNPSEVVMIGDVMDYPQPSRWSKDTAAEFQGSVFEDSDVARARLLEPLRAVYDGPVGVIEGNHDERPRVYLARYAPALAESNAFNIDNLLRFRDFGVTWLPDFYDFHEGWTICHGHRGGIRLQTVAGATALNAVRRFNKSVIMGHTHRLGSIGFTHGYNGDADVMWGVEVGHMLDMKLQTYLKGATMNWQQGFAIIRIDQGHVSTEIISVSANKFIVDGETFVIR